MVALAVQLRRRGADVRMCAPPDPEFVELLARARVPLVPFVRPWRSWEHPPTADERRQRVADFITAQYDTVAEAAADCVVGEVNHQQLFDRVAAVVHHGGAGTTTTAFRAGTPQVVVPQGGDQVYWAGRVDELGIGAAHDGPTPTVESLATALSAALRPQTRARAAVMVAEARVDGASTAAQMLLDGLS